MPKECSHELHTNKLGSNLLLYGFKTFFESINNIQTEYNWLPTGLELNWMPDDFFEYVEQNLDFEENGYGKYKLN